MTLFGQSAGGASVCDAAASPTAAGLFQKGISESGFFNYWDNTIWANGDCKSKMESEDQAQQDGAAFAAKVGCSGPTINGTTLPISAAEAIRTNQLNDIRLMIGVARDEFNGGEYGALVANTPADYRTLVRQQFGSLASTVLALYPLARFPDSSPFIAYRTVMADSASVCPGLVADQQLAHDVPTYAFENDNADTPTASTLPLGAFHNAENPFLFPSGTLTFTPDQAAFGDQIVAEWTGFARTGNPTVPGAPRWTRYTTNRQSVMSLVPAGDSALVSTASINRQHNCGFWNAVNRNALWAG